MKYGQVHGLTGRAERPDVTDEAWPVTLLVGGRFTMLDYTLAVSHDGATVCADLPGGAGHVCCFAAAYDEEHGSREMVGHWGWLGRTRADGHESWEDGHRCVAMPMDPETYPAPCRPAGPIQRYLLEGGAVQVHWDEIATPIDTDSLFPPPTPGRSWLELVRWVRFRHGQDERADRFRWLA